MTLYWLLIDYGKRIEALEAGQGRSHEIAPKPSDRRSAIATAEAFRDAGIVIGVPLKEPAEH